MSNKVSIVLPTYNRPDLLFGAVASCLAQSYKNIELIIVDDGSERHARDKLRLISSRDRRIRLVMHEHNQGLPEALNSGFKVAHGEYLTWISDDNRFEPDALMLMLDFLKQEPTVDLVYTGYKIVDANGMFMSQERPPGIKGMYYDNCVGPCFLYGRRVYEKIGEYSSSVALWEDYDYWLRLLESGLVIKSVPGAPYRFRYHQDSLTFKFMKKGSRAMVETFNVFARRHFGVYPWIEDYWRAKIYFRQENYRMAYKFTGQAIRRRYWDSYLWGKLYRLVRPNLRVRKSARLLGERLARATGGWF